MIVLSGHARAGIARLAIASGADGFCQKGSSLDELISATRRVLLGRKYLSDHLKIDSVTQASGHGERFDRRHIDKLTNREREVVELFIMGMSISEIAKKLSRDRKTISGHKQSAYRKLGISSDSEMFHLRSFLV
ncbi:DNA-binding response regulator, partial [Burkholderia cenocepacia]